MEAYHKMGLLESWCETPPKYYYNRPTSYFDTPPDFGSRHLFYTSNTLKSIKFVVLYAFLLITTLVGEVTFPFMIKKASKQG